MKRITGTLLVLTGLAGCASQPQEPDYVLDERSISALASLRDVSVEARHELRLLAKAQESMAQESMTPEQHQQRAFESTHVPKGFDERKTFVFQGPAVEAAEALAILAGYGKGGFKIVGKPIANEPLVFIDIRNRPLVEALHEIGMQTGNEVRIEVFEHQNLIRYVYADQ